MSVELDDKAPDFTLPTDGAGTVTLSKLNGKKVVLYFYPKDDTSGCTAEACGFRDSFPDYGGTAAVVPWSMLSSGPASRPSSSSWRSAWR